MTDREIMQQALNALKLHLLHHEHGCVYLNPVMYALEAALAQPEQAEYDKFSFCGRVLDWNRKQEKPPIEIPKEYWVAQELWNLFYAAQPEPPFKLSDAGADTNIPLWGLEPKGEGMVELHQREWVGLTDEQLSETYNELYTQYTRNDVNIADFILIARTIEAKLKEITHDTNTDSNADTCRNVCGGLASADT